MRNIYEGTTLEPIYASVLEVRAGSHDRSGYIRLMSTLHAGNVVR